MMSLKPFRAAGNGWLCTSQDFGERFETHGAMSLLHAFRISIACDCMLPCSSGFVL